VKSTHQHRVQLYRVIKVRQLLHQWKWLTRSQIQQKFPHLILALYAMETIASKGGRTDPGGHQWPPTYPRGSK